MSFNKRISKFLVAMTIGTCVLSNFNCCVSGMEKSNEVSKDKYQFAFDEIVFMFKDFINKNNLRNDAAKWYVAFDILLFVRYNFDKCNIDYLKKMGKINEKDSLGSIREILLECMLKPKNKMPFQYLNKSGLSVKRLGYLGEVLIKNFCDCLMTRLKNICCRNTMSEDERIENFINILQNVPLTSSDVEMGSDNVEDKLKEYCDLQCEICYNMGSNFSTMIPCGHKLCESCFYGHSSKQKYEYEKENVTCPFCCQPITDWIPVWEQYKNN